MNRKQFKKLSLQQKIKKADWNDWLVLLQTENIPESILREYKDQIGQLVLVQKVQLSKDFLREIFSNSDNYLNQNISSFQHLDQKFIEEQKDRIDWGWLSLKQNNFSQQFLLKWNQKIWWDHIWTKKRKWSQEFWEYLKKKVEK